MSNHMPFNHRINGQLAFLQEFLKHPLQIGSIIPSSRFLERRIVTAAEVASSDVIVELGPGTGGTTRAILRAMSPQARLLAVEINPRFHTLVRAIRDRRLIAHLGSALELKDILSMYHLDTPKAVISGIPFSTISRSQGRQILETISGVIHRKGHFVAYQVSNRVADLCRSILGPVETTTEFLNIPPMHIYRWGKRTPAHR